MNCISYKKGYKYQIVDSYTVDIPIKPEADIASPSTFIQLTKQGKLTLKQGYAWDGPSGPTIDTLNFMRGSLVHDALYQLMREGSLVSSEAVDYRLQADKLLQQMCIEDGMSKIRAQWVYLGVRLGGEPAADPKSKKPVTKAPEGCTP